jgi:hypothetical protein
MINRVPALCVVHSNMLVDYGCIDPSVCMG